MKESLKETVDKLRTEIDDLKALVESAGINGYGTGTFGISARTASIDFAERLEGLEKRLGIEWCPEKTTKKAAHYQKK